MTAMVASGKLLGLAVAAILGVALVLRLAGNWTQCLWWDEMLSVRYASYSFFSIPWELKVQSSHPPMFFWVLHLWNQFGALAVEPIFGPGIVGSDEWYRVPSLMCSLLLIPIAGKLAFDLFDRATSLVAMVLLAFSVFQIHYAQETRMYALMALCGTISQLFFHRLLVRPTRWAWVGYLLATTALMYTHVFGLFTIFGQSLYFAGEWYWRRRHGKLGVSVKQWLFSQACLGIVFLPWVWMLVFQVRNVERYDWIRRSPPNLPILASGGSPSLDFLLLSLVAVGAFDAWRRGSIRSHLFLLAWLATPMATASLIAWLHQPICLPRHLILCSVALMMGAANGLTSLSRLQLPATKWAALGLLLALTIQELHGYYAEFKHPDWESSAAWFDEHARPEALLLCNSLHTGYAFDYYRKRKDIREFPMFVHLNPRNLKPADFQWVQNHLEGAPEAWLIHCDRAEHQTKPYSEEDVVRLQEIFGAGYKLDWYRDWSGVLQVRFVRADDAAAIKEK